MSVISADEPQIKDFEPFDYGVWGAIVRKQRKELNYNAEQFTDFLELATRIRIHPQTYYKIEQGKQSPTHSQYMAINLAVFDDVEPPEEVKQMCLSKEWKQTIETLKKVDNKWEFDGVLVPYEWACINFVYSKQKIEEDLNNPDDPVTAILTGEEKSVSGIEKCSDIMEVPQGYFRVPKGYF